jgi:hypothetical protein
MALSKRFGQTFIVLIPLLGLVSTEPAGAQ